MLHIPHSALGFVTLASVVEWSMSISQNERVNKKLFCWFSVAQLFLFPLFYVQANHTRWPVITRSSNALRTVKIQESTVFEFIAFLSLPHDREAGSISLLRSFIFTHT